MFPLAVFAQCTYFHSSLHHISCSTGPSRQSVFVFASCLLDTQCCADRMFIRGSRKRALSHKVNCRHATRHIVCHALCLCQRGTVQRPASKFECSQFCGVACVPHDRCALAIKFEADINSHICSHCVGSGISDVRITRHWTSAWPSQVMVVGARVVVVCFPLVLGVRSRSDGSRQPHPSTCALVDVKSVELGADRFCHVCVMLKSAC